MFDYHGLGLDADYHRVAAAICTSKMEVERKQYSSDFFFFLLFFSLLCRGSESVSLLNSIVTEAVIKERFSFFFFFPLFFLRTPINTRTDFEKTGLVSMLKIPCRVRRQR